MPVITFTKNKELVKKEELGEEKKELDQLGENLAHQAAPLPVYSAFPQAQRPLQLSPF
jgi:hypothetical protein